MSFKVWEAIQAYKEGKLRSRKMTVEEKYTREIQNKRGRFLQSMFYHCVVEPNFGNDRVFKVMKNLYRLYKGEA